jgi:hypothetical protein
MAMYCCVEHQKQDWPLHKLDCQVFKRLDIRAVFYKDEDMLTKFPLRSPAAAQRLCKESKVDTSGGCPLCGKTAQEVEMTVTRCCARPVCDTEGQYVMMSYSREFCPRSHDRYTLCGYHGVEKQCERNKDWRECRGCTKCSDRDVSDMLWRGLNPYNFYPMLARDVPRHSLCDSCDGCGKKFVAGLEGSSFGPGGYTCLGCTGRPTLV